MGGQSRPSGHGSQSSLYTTKPLVSPSNGANISAQQASSSHRHGHSHSHGSPSKHGDERRHKHEHRDKKEKKEKRRIVEWKYTTAPMNARDLARDDDFVRYAYINAALQAIELNLYFTFVFAFMRPMSSYQHQSYVGRVSWTCWASLCAQNGCLS